MDLPKTIYFNFEVFDIKTAIKFPILISHKVNIKEIHKGCVVIPPNPKMFGISIGIVGVEGVSTERKSFIMLGKNARLIFYNNISLFRGISLRSSDGIIEFGENFYCNCNLSIICGKSITFGDD